MPRLLLVLMVTAGLGLVGSIGLLITTAVRSEGRSSALEQDPVLTGLVVPPFELVDQDGQRVDAGVFDGEVTVLTFFFTNCVSVCPILTGQMYDLHERMAGTDVRQVSISVDPVHDTPEALRAYAERYGVDTDRWSFLTGEWEMVERIARDGLKFAIQEDPSAAAVIDLGEGRSMPNILHPTHLLLIGPDRSLIGYYSMSDASALDALESRLRMILLELG